MRNIYSSKFSRTAIRRRFFKAIKAIQSMTGWSVKDMSKHYQVPERSLVNWLSEEACPKLPRLKRLCRVFNWNFETMFEKEAIVDEMFERAHLDLNTLNRRFLSLQHRDPLESWNYVSLAGALVFNTLSAAGYECRLTVDHSFGTRVVFLNPALHTVGLRVEVVAGRGLMINWTDEHGHARKEAMDLSNSTLDLILKSLHSLCKA